MSGTGRDIAIELTVVYSASGPNTRHYSSVVEVIEVVGVYVVRGRVQGPGLLGTKGEALVSRSSNSPTPAALAESIRMTLTTIVGALEAAYVSGTLVRHV